MITISQKLNAKQHKSIPLLASGMPAVAVAAIIKVSAPTISRWRKSTSFNMALKAYKQKAIAAIEAELDDLAGDSVKTLRNLLEHSDSDSVKLRACIFIIERMEARPTPPEGEGEGIDLPGLLKLLSTGGTKQ